MSDEVKCPNCGRPTRLTSTPTRIVDFCFAGEPGPSTSETLSCLRLTVEHMRPVVEAARAYCTASGPALRMTLGALYVALGLSEDRAPRKAGAP